MQSELYDKQDLVKLGIADKTDSFRIITIVLFNFFPCNRLIFASFCLGEAFSKVFANFDNMLIESCVSADVDLQFANMFRTDG